MCVREPRVGINSTSVYVGVAISYPDEAEGSYKFIMLPKS